MKAETFNILAVNDEVIKNLAKLMARDCFRNTYLEELHSGVFPSSKKGDYSDVTVKTPSGTIKWNDLSRFNDDEMKKLMINVVNYTWSFLHLLFRNSDVRYVDELICLLRRKDVLPDWENPPTFEYYEEMRRARKALRKIRKDYRIKETEGNY